jgi:hypothetical protein
MSLEKRLDKIEAAMRGREPPHGSLLFYLHAWAEGCPVAFEPWEVDELSPRFEAMALSTTLLRPGRSGNAIVNE